MRIGVINMPGRHTYNKQNIKTRFFILGVPLFPTGCIYQVSDNLGMNVPLTGVDIFHAYAKIHFGLLGVGLFMWSSNLRQNGALIGILGLVLVCLCIYSWVAHRGATEQEQKDRRIFGNAFLYNMPPEYLPKNIQKSLFAELMKTYISRTGKLEWKQDILDGNVSKSNFSLLYTIAYYTKVLEPSVNNTSLFQQIEGYLTGKRQLRTKTVVPENKTTNQAFASSKQEKTSDPAQDEGMEKVFKILKEIQNENKTQKPKTANHAQSSFASATSSTKTGSTTENEGLIRMSAQDVKILHRLKNSMTNQILVLVGGVLVASIVVAAISGNPSVMVYVFPLILIIMGAITAAVFIPPYSKINRDLTQRRKVKTTVRITDIAKEQGAVYLMPAPNKYRIKKLTAPAEFYSMNLLGKEVEIYVSKESHTLLEIVRVNY